MGLADSRHFLHLVRAMVAEPYAGAQAWAEAAGVPVPSAYRVVRFFRYQGALVDGGLDKRRVLRLAADLRRDRAVPAKQTTAGEMQRKLGDGRRYQLAFQSAANLYGFFEESEVTIRIHPELVPEAPFPLFLSNAWDDDTPVSIYIEDLDRFPAPVNMKGVEVTDPVITLMDLYSHPRAGAHAEFLDGVLVDAGILPERRR